MGSSFFEIMKTVIHSQNTKKFELPPLLRYWYRKIWIVVQPQHPKVDFPFIFYTSD